VYSATRKAQTARMLIPKRISGAPLRALAAFARTRTGSAVVQRQLLEQLAIHVLGELPDSARTALPISNRVLAGRPPRSWQSQAGGAAATAIKPWSPTSASIANAYRIGDTSPRILLEQCLRYARDLQARSCGPLSEVREQEVLRAADKSTERWRNGKQLSAMDGVPFAVKEQIAVTGYSRRLGTSFLPLTNLDYDATIVARLRALGAIPVGLTPMTEFGMTPTGVNSKRAMPRNPHNAARIAGGSSTGSGVAVATGLVPFALGADGGGSIRIPSAMCGIFGIKPTWGRMSRHGDPSGGSVAHVGPMASSMTDLAHVLAATSGHCAQDDETAHTPAPADYVQSTQSSIRGVVIGVCKGEWADAAKDVGAAGESALRALEKRGAVLRDIELPIAKHAAAMGYVTIACEARANLRENWRDHADDMSHDLQVSFAALDAFSAMEFADVQRLRGGLRREAALALQTIDAFALPGMQQTAREVSDAQHLSGILDAELIDGLCRFMFFGNLTGLPALVAPIGTDKDGLPYALQLMGDAWDEGTLLAIGAEMEREGIAQVQRPRIAVDMLP
jgi:aspartyl-tRNA(Asn)/glutamyl-tRNA(Gln) amidotransferase subunit A